MSATQTVNQTQKLLQASWNEWTGVVRRFARQGMHSGEYSRQHYRDLHSTLQQHIDKSLVDMSTDAGVLQGMKELSSPWPSVESLASADKKLLADLLSRCNAVQKAPAHTPASPRRYFTAITLPLVLMLAAAVVILSPEISREILELLPVNSDYAITGFLRTLLRNARELQYDILVICVASAVMMVTWLVFRPPGRY
jgi:hypothetical protein